MNGAIICLLIQICLFYELNNPSQRRYTSVKLAKLQGFMQQENENNLPMVPPLGYFQGKNENCSSFARTISASRRSFFANLTTFERHSGLKKFSLLKITILKMGWLSKFQSHRSWGDAHLSFGRRKRPQLKWDQPKTYKFWQSPHFQNCDFEKGKYL